MSSEMSSTTRKYQQRARAASQQETRERIAAVAADLHEEFGVARTTVAEIARRAGVSRLTVYNHFPDLDALLPACTAHYERQHPFPDLARALAVEEPQERVVAVLTLLYGWYRDTEAMFTKVLSDRSQVPELDRFLRGGIDRTQQQVADALALPGGDPGRAALLRVATDFWTWSRLTREGLDDRAAASLMARAACCA